MDARVRSYYVRAQKLHPVVMVGYIALSFLERPSWCYTSETCGNPNNILVSGLPMLPTWLTQTIEMIFLALLLLELFVKRLYRVRPCGFMVATYRL